METVTLSGTGTQNLTWVYKIKNTIFLLADILFLGFVLDLDEYIFPWNVLLDQLDATIMIYW
jgi:hypothetical protein